MRVIWQRLSKREKGLVGSALFILLLVLGRFFLVSPLLERRAWVKGQLDIYPQLYQKNLRYIDRQKEIEEALAGAKKELKALEPSLLSGDTPSVGASALQEIVQAIAAREGTQVITTRVLNPESKGVYTRIPVQVEVSGQIDQVAKLIKGIESAKKLLVVDELNIRSLFRPGAARRRRAAARRRAASRVPAGQLRARLVVSGVMQSQADSQLDGQSLPAEKEMSPAKNSP